MQQLKDSSVIMSILSTYLLDKNQSLETIEQCYPMTMAIDGRGTEFVNRYSVMYGDKNDALIPKPKVEK